MAELWVGLVATLIAMAIAFHYVTTSDFKVPGLWRFLALFQSWPLLVGFSCLLLLKSFKTGEVLILVLAVNLLMIGVAVRLRTIQGRIETIPFWRWFGRASRR